jgi:IstB-like ATP binding protein
METLTTVPLLIMDDFGMRKLSVTAAEDLLEIVRRRYECASTLLTSNLPVEVWGKLLGDVAAVTAMLDRLLHHGHLPKCSPAVGAPKRRQPASWRPPFPTQHSKSHEMADPKAIRLRRKEFHPSLPVSPPRTTRCVGARRLTRSSTKSACSTIQREVSTEAATKSSVSRA